MSILHFKDGCVIDRVHVVKTPGGGSRAYIHAHPQADKASLIDIKKNFKQKGWQMAPAHLNGEPLLELRGFRNQEALFGTLRGKQYVSGKATRETTPDDKITWKDSLSSNTLMASGLIYFAGDFGYAKYGYNKASPLDFAAGISYFGGSATLAAFGQGDKSFYQLRDISRKLVRFIGSSGMEIPKDSAAYSITHDPNTDPLSKLKDFFSTYPSEIMNSFFALAGVLISTAAYKSLREENLTKAQRTTKYKDMGLGLMTAGSGLLSAFIEEEAPDPTKPKPSNPVSWIWQWIKEKPLRIAGWGYIVSTLIHANSTYHDWRDAKANPHTEENKRMLKSVPYRGLFVAANLVAEFLMSISSKGHGDGVKSDKSLDDSVYAVAADLIYKQPAKYHEMLKSNMAGFLSHPDVRGGNVNDHQREIEKQYDVIKNNVWFQDYDIVSEAEKIAAKEWEKTPATEEAKTDWVTRTKQPAAAGAHVGPN